MWLSSNGPTIIHENAGLIANLALWAGDLALLWLCCELAAADLIRPLAWELPCAVGAALKRPKKKKVKVSAGLLALWSTKEVFISLFF